MIGLPSVDVFLIPSVLSEDGHFFMSAESTENDAKDNSPPDSKASGH